MTGAFADESWIWSGARPWWNYSGIMVRDMDGRGNAQRCRSFSECAASRPSPAREYPAAVSEKVLIRKGATRCIDELYNGI